MTAEKKKAIGNPECDQNPESLLAGDERSICIQREPLLFKESANFVLEVFFCRAAQSISNIETMESAKPH
jgi:hypothetical protein